MKIPKIILLLVVLLCAGCEARWIERHEPSTDAERKAVAAYVEKIMEATPKSLAGHDQDWDDAIKAAHWSGCQIYCVPTYWEWIPGDESFTGRWRYAQEMKP